MSIAVTVYWAIGRLIPVALHADDGPAVLLLMLASAFVKRVFDLGKPVRGRSQIRAIRRRAAQATRTARRCALVYIFIDLVRSEVKVALKQGHGAASMGFELLGLLGLVVVEVQCRQTHEHGLAVTQFELRLHAAADDRRPEAV